VLEVQEGKMPVLFKRWRPPSRARTIRLVACCGAARLEKPGSAIFP